MTVEENKSESKRKSSANHHINKRKQTAIIGGLALLFILTMGVSTYAYAFASLTLPNIYIASIKTSGKNLTDAAQLISDKVQETYANPISIVSAEKTMDVHAADVGVVVDSKASAVQGYDFGRRNSFSESVWDYIKQPFAKTNLQLVITYDQDKLDKLVDKFAVMSDQPEINAGVKIEKGKAVETSATNGYRIDKNEVKNVLLTAFRNNQNNSITFQRYVAKPEITSGNAKSAVAQAEKLRKAKITLDFADKEASPNQNTFDSWIGSILIDGKLYAGVDQKKVQDWLTTIAPDLNQDPVEARIAMVDGQIKVQVAGSDGKSLDEENTAPKITEAVKNYVVNQKNDKSIIVSAVIKTIKPVVTEDNIASLGIIEQIGTATTSFSGSPDNRKHNISVGAKALNGVIVKPGEEFSTLKNLGKIDQTSGYLPELVIKVNKTIPEYGGGLCQVSTTLFRATMNSGLKVTERQNHRYRVGYYEPPVGMDATIYEGSPDFKFVNNYANSVLIQSSVAGTKITFDMYGKKDGRRSELSTPSVYDVVNPPDLEYTNTDTLPEGTTKRIESAHPGASASFTYIVYKEDGSTLTKQTFVSKYVPWQAKYLRGTAKPAETPAVTTTPSPSPSTSSTP